MENFLECPSCGLKQNKTFAYCVHCGAQLSAAPQHKREQYQYSLSQHVPAAKYSPISIYSQRMRVYLSESYPSWIMKTAFLIIILNNIGWILVLVLSPFTTLSYITPSYEDYFTPIWVLMANFCFLSDILGFSILGISLVLIKQTSEGSEEDQSLLFAGGSFFTWSVLAILWRFLGPLALGYPIAGDFGTGFNLSFYNDPVLIVLFLTNGFVMILGTYFLMKMFETKLLLSYGILNLIGVISFVISSVPIMGNIESQMLISIFFLGGFGFLSKVLFTPCFGVLTFTRIWNILRSYLATQ
ncbi:MAG: hypothetical protein ACFFAJ_16690 [Candidatus Hodarchaeota archaeon]